MTQETIPLWGSQWSCPIGHVLGTHFRVHYLFILYFILSFFDLFIQKKAKGWILMYNLFSLVIIWLSVMAMVGGRMLATRSLGGQTQSVLLWPFGTFTSSEYAKTRRSQCCISSGGPLALVPVAIIWWLIWNANEADCEYKFLGFDENWKDCFGANLCSFGFSSTMFLIGVNLVVPSYPFGGAHIFVALLSVCGPSLNIMAIICLIVNVSVFISFAVLAILYHHWLSVLFALFLLYETYRLWRFYKNHQLQTHPLFQDVYTDSTGTPDANYIGPSLLSSADGAADASAFGNVEVHIHHEPEVDQIFGSNNNPATNMDNSRDAYSSSNPYESNHHSVPEISNPYDSSTGNQMGSSDPYESPYSSTGNSSSGNNYGSEVNPFGQKQSTDHDPFASSNNENSQIVSGDSNGQGDYGTGVGTGNETASNNNDNSFGASDAYDYDNTGAY